MNILRLFVYYPKVLQWEKFRNLKKEGMLDKFVFPVISLVRGEWVFIIDNDILIFIKPVHSVCPVSSILLSSPHSWLCHIVSVFSWFYLICLPGVIIDFWDFWWPSPQTPEIFLYKSKYVWAFKVRYTWYYISKIFTH